MSANDLRSIDEQLAIKRRQAKRLGERIARAEHERYVAELEDAVAWMKQTKVCMRQGTDPVTIWEWYQANPKS